MELHESVQKALKDDLTEENAEILSYTGINKDDNARIAAAKVEGYIYAMSDFGHSPLIHGIKYTERFERLVYLLSLLAVDNALGLNDRNGI